MLKFTWHLSTPFWGLLSIGLVSVYQSSFSVTVIWISHCVFIILNDTRKRISAPEVIFKFFQILQFFYTEKRLFISISWFLLLNSLLIQTPVHLWRRITSISRCNLIENVLQNNLTVWWPTSPPPIYLLIYKHLFSSSKSSSKIRMWDSCVGEFTLRIFHKASESDEHLLNKAAIWFLFIKICFIKHN